MKVLLLEDELMLQGAIKEYLSDTGFEVTAFEDGKEAYENIASNSYDLFIFDINTPSMDGLSLLDKLQKEKIYVPTIFISAITEIEQISQAYALGCYDYLKKPFHLKELSLHIERLLKMADIRAKDLIKISKMYSYDAENKSLFFDGEAQLLTQKQLQILDLFAKNINKVVDFEMLRHYAWDDNPVDNAIIRAEIHRLRQVLKEDLITTLKGVGYTLSKQI
ncbi:response regulator transcription factor [Sulfurovum sp. XTW-4]|uniref:Response regulator transcription factor n=1 Tax=Sulfurovum xiamenensis TaxID=3019066 RepID=A0ABT7QP11_9BACT|nr:response regulator transcription factor [Sulfurovum xiamenensis]MDM5262736.1 response regulator transcription factor [Sulfurovum xiamenensis]